jgi:hypothetical protein
MKIAGTVDRFTVCIHVYIYLVRLISAWIYVITTLALIALTHMIVTSSVEFLYKVSIIMNAMIVPMWSCVFLVLFFGFCCLCYGIIVRRSSRLTSDDRILLWLSFDVFMNAMGTNWIANWLGVPEIWPMRMLFLFFWCVHTITTAISLVLIGKRICVYFVRYSRLSTCNAEEEQISLLTMPMISAIVTVAEKQKPIHYQNQATA